MFKEIYKTLHVNQRLYINTAVLLVIYLLALLSPSEKAEQGFLWLFLLCWFAAICYDVAGLYEKVYRTIIGKALLIMVFTLCTNLAIALSMQQVNSNVGTDPTLFPHTITYITILSIPVFLAIGLGTLSVLLMFVFPFVILYHTVPDDEFKEILIPGSVRHSDTPYLRKTRVVQLNSFIVFCGLVLSHSNNINSNPFSLIQHVFFISFRNV